MSSTEKTKGDIKMEEEKPEGRTEPRGGCQDERRGEEETTEKEIPESQMTMNELLARGGITTCASCQSMSYITRNSVLRSEKLQGCQREGCRSNRSWRGVQSPYSKYPWPEATMKQPRGGRQLPCLRYASGEGCPRGNECHLKHENIEDDEERWNRCFVC